MLHRRDGFRVALVTGCALGCLADPAPSSRSPSGTPSATWPNEPAGMTVVADWGLEQDLPVAGDVPIPGSPGWNVVYGFLPGPLIGTAHRATDPEAPLSPPDVYDFVYPQGMVEGLAPATVYFPRGSSGGIKGLLGLSSRDVLRAKEIYAGFWWKPSAPFDFGPNGNKIAFLFNGAGNAGGQQFIILRPDGRLHVLPEYPGDFRWREPNVNATVVTLGAWHRIEWYSNITTGTLKWWLDGVLLGDHHDVWNAHDFDMFQFSPTWGGNSGAAKRQTDHYWFDHVRLSVR